MDSHKMSKFLCLVHLQWLSEKDDSSGIAMKFWLKEQSGMPSHMWCRPSGQQEDRTPPKMMTENLAYYLSRQYWTYKNKDPQQVQQKALPFIVLDEFAKLQVTELDMHWGNSLLEQHFLHVILANTRLFPKEKRNVQSYYVYKILDYSRKGILF